MASLARGFRRPEDRRLGLEFEQFLTNPEGFPLPYAGSGGVEEIVKALGHRLGWTCFGEGDFVFGLQSPDGQQVTLEPGAQIELGTTPCRKISELEAQIRPFQAALEAVVREHGGRVLAVGAQPMASPEDITRLPKSRYDILDPWLRDADELGLWMMRCTCGMQVNFDHTDAADAARKLRTVFRLSPVITALFANSSQADGKETGFASWRGHVWSKTDASRCGIVDSLAVAGSTLEDYVEWILDVPMLFVERDGQFEDCRGQSFRTRIEEGSATLKDWELHLSTPFPEVRLRPQIELRCADAGSLEMALALSALVKGIFYDAEALSAAEALVAPWSLEELHAAWHRSHRDGLGDLELAEQARALLALVSLNAEEDGYLAPLRERLAIL
jgi:glutamate--cysteine ligase